MIKVSNYEWFKQYVFYRKCLLFSCVVFVILILGINYFVNNQIIESLVYVYPLAIILTIIIFDWSQKPAYFSVSELESETDIMIELFLPDSRYHIVFNENLIKRYHINFENRPTFIIKKQAIPILDKISIQIHQSDGGLLATPFISFSWASKIDTTNLSRIGKVKYC